MRRIFAILTLAMAFMSVYSQKYERRCYKNVLNCMRFVPQIPHHEAQYYYLNNDCWEIRDSCNVEICADGDGTTIKNAGGGSGVFRAVYHFNFLYGDHKSATLTGTVGNLSGTDRVGITLFQGDNADDVVMTEKDSIFSLTIPYTNQVNSSHSLAIYIDASISGGRAVRFHGLNVVLDGVDADDANPLPRANDDHEFDVASRFSIGHELTDREIKRLEKICVLWGFLKYYHPVVRTGEYNWNYQLLRMLNLYCEDSDDVFNHKLLQTIPHYKDLLRKENRNTNPVIEKVKFLWKDMLCDDIVRAIDDITKLDRTDPNVINAGHAEDQKEALLTHFRNEPAYDDIDVSDDGYRLMSLFRVWNMMYYFHPFMPQKEKYWIEILPEYVRLFVGSSDKQAYDYACARLVCELKDTHCMMYGARYNGIDDHVWKPYYLPMELHFCNGNLLITKLKTEAVKVAGLKVGDIITAVNDTLMSDICKERDKYSPLSKPDSDYFDGAYASVGTNRVCYTVLRDGRKVRVEIPDIKECWRGYTERAPDTMRVINDNTYYINLCAVTWQDLSVALDRAKSFGSIIFDMRGYPNNCNFMTLTQMISDFLYPERKSLFVRSYADIVEPGVFRRNHLDLSFGRDNPDYYKGKAIVLVNSLTMSAAEWVAGIIRNAPKGMTVGSPTSGTLGNVVNVPFINGVWARFSNIGFYDMNGRNTYPDGITVDHEVRPEQLDLNLYDDYLLEEAVNIVNK